MGSRYLALRDPYLLSSMFQNLPPGLILFLVSSCGSHSVFIPPFIKFVNLCVCELLRRSPAWIFLTLWCTIAIDSLAVLTRELHIYQVHHVTPIVDQIKIPPGSHTWPTPGISVAGRHCWCWWWPLHPTDRDDYPDGQPVCGAHSCAQVQIQV